jgi:hypothetical protein
MATKNNSKNVGTAADPQRLIARVREIAMALPGTTEKLSHGEPAFFRGRMFITVDNNHHGSGHVAIWCRAEPGAQSAFVDAAPEHFFVPPYVGSQGWLGVRLDSGLDWKAIAGCIESAWREAKGATPTATKPPRGARAPGPRTATRRRS